MAFPSSPSNDDLHTEFGRTFKYSSASNSWSAATPDAPPETAPTTLGITASADLPLTNVIPGTKAFSTEENKLFLATGNGWFEIALLENTSPTITTGADASYALSGDGTPTVITLSATDPEGVPITWGYQVTSGSLEDTVITNEGGVFTITPGSIEVTFNLSFTASDGVNIDTSASSFELAFAPSGNVLYTILNPNLGTYNTSHAGNNFGNRVVIGDTYFAAFAPGESKSNPAGSLTAALYVFNLADGSLYWHTIPTTSTYNPEFIRMTSTGIYFRALHYEMKYVRFSSMPTMAAGADSNQSRTAASNKGFLNFKADDNYVVYVNGNSGTDSRGQLTVGSPESMSPIRLINNPNVWTGYDNGFGYGLGLYGTTAYVGASEQKGINDSTTSVGVVYVFDITNGSLIHTIPSPDQNTSTSFGSIVDASEDYIAVYASGPKALYIYNRSDYTLRHTIYLSSLGLSEVHSEAFTADGKYLMMGWGFTQKVVVVDMSSGSLVLTLNNPNTQSSPNTTDYYGYSASMFNKKIIVGAMGESAPNGQDGAGYVYVYGD
jgi:hypothetical protein